MNYKLKVLSIYELGQRKNQEDYIYPLMGGDAENSRLFIVCDGMGGHEKGEVASKTVCEKLSEYITENYDPENIFTEDIFNAALSYAYDALDALDDGAEKKMGTTLTFLMFHNDGCLLAHIGDSRIYHIRPSENGDQRIRYVTRDHSLVNDLVSIGEMTAEEAKTSRQKNIITRAMQPNQERRSRADIHNIEDIRSGDYFYMCSDGMLEQAEDVEIANVISMANKTDEEKIEMFKSLTQENKDNHSAHLIRVLSIGDNDDTYAVEELPESRNAWKVAIIALAVILGLCYFFRNDIKTLFQVRDDRKGTVMTPAEPQKPSFDVNSHSVQNSNADTPATETVVDPDDEMETGEQMPAENAGPEAPSETSDNILKELSEQMKTEQMKETVITRGQEDKAK